MLDILSILQGDGYKVTFFALRHTPNRSYEDQLRNLGVQIIFGLCPEAEHAIKAGTFSLAIIHFWRAAENYLPYIRSLCPSTKIIIDTVDVHFLREIREAFAGSTPGEALLRKGVGNRAVRELSLYSRADAVIVVSNEERRYLDNLLLGKTRVFPVVDYELAKNPAGYSDRAGVIFVGNFWHRPNIDAVTFFVDRIWPLVPEAIRASDPFTVFGNASERVSDVMNGRGNTQIAGWVPQLDECYRKARVVVVPLRYGAGTKRKVLQALAEGVPVIATRCAAEGMPDLVAGKHYLVADTPVEFAHKICLLLKDRTRWDELSAAGPGYIRQYFSQETAAAQIRAGLESIDSSPPLANRYASSQLDLASRRLVVSRALNRFLREHLVQGTALFVVDDQYVDSLHVPGCVIDYWGSEEIGGLFFESLQGALNSGKQLAVLVAKHLVDDVYLADAYEKIRSDFCQDELEVSGYKIFYTSRDPNLHPRRSALTIVSKLYGHALIQQRRPKYDWNGFEWAKPTTSMAVLVLGVYLADQPSNVHDIVQTLGGADLILEQRWAGLNGPAPTSAVADVTSLSLVGPRPKWSVINELAGAGSVDAFDFIIVIDDDIILPEDFLYRFVGIQQRLGLSIAQPARTQRSSADYPIVYQQPGMAARETWFVESGPLVSFSRKMWNVLAPFDERSPMGWGYSNVWACSVHTQGEKMGIIDVCAIDHSLRPTAQYYSSTKARRDRTYLLESVEHWSYSACQRVTKTYTLDLSVGWRQTGSDRPVITVIVATFNRNELLRQCLASLNSQSLDRQSYELLVVDDGSVPTAADIALEYNATYIRIAHSGRSAARNIGIFCASGNLVHFMDDDDVADFGMLAAHVAAHEQHSDEAVAVLGHTELAPGLRDDPLMWYLTEVGGNLFSYRDVSKHNNLSFAHFWGGRISCSREFLVKHGIHDPRLEYYVDVELGYRLSRHGLRIVYQPTAVSTTIRPFTIDEFCKRCERKGAALRKMAILHQGAAEIAEYINGDRHLARWTSTSPAVALEQLEAAKALYRAALDRPVDAPLRTELYRHLKECFAYYMAKGYVSDGVSHSDHRVSAAPYEQAVIDL